VLQVGLHIHEAFLADYSGIPASVEIPFTRSNEPHLMLVVTVWRNHAARRHFDKRGAEIRRYIPGEKRQKAADIDAVLGPHQRSIDLFDKHFSNTIRFKKRREISGKAPPYLQRKYPQQLDRTMYY
jgi:hypothetical protein